MRFTPLVRSLLVACLSVSLLLLGYVWSVNGQTPPATPDVLMSWAVSPAQVILGEGDVSLRLGVEPTEITCPAITTAPPIDIVLVIDRSSSMDEEVGTGRTKMDVAREAISQFLQGIDLRRHRVAIVEFNSIGDVVIGFRQDRQTLQNALTRITPFDGTVLTAGLTPAHQLLETDRRPEAAGTIVLLTDGLGADTFIVGGVAEDIKKAGYRIITVGVGGDTDEQLLQRLASSPQDYFSALDPNDLPAIYRRIAEVIERPIPLTDVIVEVTLHPNLRINEVHGNAISQGRKIRWALHQIGGPETLEVIVRPKRAGQYPPITDGFISYTRCEADKIQQPLDLPQNITVLAPTPTPTPSPTASPTVTPSPTLAPPSAVFTPTPAPGAPPAFTPPEWCEWLLDPRWLWVLLALALLAFLVYWLARWREIRERPEENQRCFCELWPLLLIPWLIALLWRLLKEAIYIRCTFEVFWIEPWLRRALGRWWWIWLLIPILILLLWWLCRRRCPPVQPTPPPETRPRTPPEPLEPLDIEPPWQVRPALVLGVGGSGAWVLTHLKKTLLDGYLGSLPKGVRLLLIGTGKDANVEFAGVQLAPGETVLLKEDLHHLVARVAEHTGRDEDDTTSSYRPWFPARLYQGLGVQTNLAEGTFGRRPIARAGLLHHLSGNGGGRPSSPALWQKLLEVAREVYEASEDGTIDIFLVGSLAGGMSGTLADIAFLARRAGEALTGAGRVRVSGLFTTAEAYGHHTKATQAQRNTFASLRELERFQLTTLWPYPMRYPSGNGLTSLSDTHTGLLLDEVLLFGALPNIPPGKSDEPWATTLASVADLLVYYLDASISDERRTTRQKTDREYADQPRVQQHMYVGSGGTYTIRFPIRDMVEQVKLKWISALLHDALGDESSAQPDVTGAKNMGLKFLSGELPGGNVPFWWQALLSRFAVGDIPSGKSMATAFGAGVQEEIFEIFVRLWDRALSILLNGEDTGSPSAPPPVIRTSVPFTLAFCDAVSDLLDNVKANLQAVPGRSRSDPLVDDGLKRLEKAIPAWKEIVRRSKQTLAEQQALLVGGASDGTEGIARQVQVEMGRFQQWQEQMDQVAVRKYVWKGRDEEGNEVDLIEQWYEKYGVPVLMQYLSRLYWQIEQGNVTLTLVVEKSVPLTKATADEFMKALRRLGDHVFEEVWKHVAFSDLWAQQGFTKGEERRRKMLEHLWRAAEPPVRLLPGEHEQQVRRECAAGIPYVLQDRDPDFVQEIATLRNVLPSSLHPLDGSVYTFSDRYAMTFVRTLDLIPLTAIKEVDTTRGLYGRVVTEDMNEARQLHVFDAEFNAVVLEGRMPQSRQQWRVLSPHIVLAARDLEKLRRFALGWAADLFEYDEQSQRVQIRIGTQSYEAVSALHDPTLPWEVNTLLQYVSNIDVAPFLDDILADVVRKPPSEVVERWYAYSRNWHRGMPHEWQQQPRILQDLAIVAAIAVQEYVNSMR